LLLLTVIVKPIVDPVATGVASAVFTTLRFGGGGGFTTIVAVEKGQETLHTRLLANTCAVFKYVPALEPGGGVVGLCTWIVAWAPGARSPKLQLKPWLEGGPISEQVPGPA
jgi:hypothetical protein